VLLRGSGTEAVSLSTRDSKADACEVDAEMCLEVVQYPIALFFVVFSFFIYYFGLDIKEQHSYWITPGSVFGVLLWLTASFLFRVYLHFFNSYSQTYGSLGAEMILLLWFYVTGFAFLVGGEINAQIEHTAACHGHRAKPQARKL